MDIAADFLGKNALVTGGSRGIGRAVAIKLVQLGANVYAVSKNPANLESLKSEFPSVVPVVVDLGDWVATRAALESLPVMDYVVNNAAIEITGNFMQVTPEDFDVMSNVNLKGIINVSQVMAQKMMDAGKPGSIVNVSSIAGLTPLPAICSYSILKAGLDQLTKIMAIELGPSNIRVNSVNPGPVLTDMLRGILDDVANGKGDPEFLQKLTHRTASNEKMVGVDHIVNTTIFLLSNAAPTITGTRLAVDGGYSIS